VTVIDGLEGVHDDTKQALDATYFILRTRMKAKPNRAKRDLTRRARVPAARLMFGDSNLSGD